MSSLADTLDKSVSKTPDAKSATSKLVIEFPVPLASIVLFVNVVDDEAVATVASTAMVKVSVATPVVVIPVPPWTLKVSPVEIVWSAPPSPDIIKSEETEAIPGSNLPVDEL